MKLYRANDIPMILPMDTSVRDVIAYLKPATNAARARAFQHSKPDFECFAKAFAQPIYTADGKISEDLLRQVSYICGLFFSDPRAALSVVPATAFTEAADTNMCAPILLTLLTALTHSNKYDYSCVSPLDAFNLLNAVHPTLPVRHVCMTAPQLLSKIQAHHGDVERYKKAFPQCFANSLACDLAEGELADVLDCASKLTGKDLCNENVTALDSLLGTVFDGFTAEESTALVQLILAALSQKKGVQFINASRLYPIPDDFASAADNMDNSVRAALESAGFLTSEPPTYCLKVPFGDNTLYLPDFSDSVLETLGLANTMLGDKLVRCLPKSRTIMQYDPALFANDELIQNINFDSLDMQAVDMPYIYAWFREHRPEEGVYEDSAIINMYTAALQRDAELPTIGNNLFGRSRLGRVCSNSAKTLFDRINNVNKL